MNPRSSHPVQALAFDLDGTLVDSAPDIAHALNYALAAAGLPEFALTRVLAWIGDGPDPLIARALAACGAEPTAALRSALRADFDRHTLAAPLAAGRVFAGVEPLLRQLQPDWPMVVVTNKPTALARAVLDAAGLRPFMASVHGADTPELRKPAAALLLQAARRLGLQPSQLLMVGDSAADMGAAAAAGAPAVWAGWGYGELKTLSQPPRWRIGQPAELPALLGLRAARGR